MATLDLAIPENKDVALGLPSNILYQLEQAGSLATEVLDERVAEWAEEGKTQEWMASEIDCDQSSVSRRLKRLGVLTKSPQAGKAGRPSNMRAAYSEEDEEIIEVQPEDIIEEPSETHAHCTHCEVHCPSSRYRKEH